MTTFRRSLPALILGRLAPGNVPIDVDYWEPAGALKFTTKPLAPKQEPREKVRRSASIEDWRACGR
jgi:hypothetical protein